MLLSFLELVALSVQGEIDENPRPSDLHGKISEILPINYIQMCTKILEIRFHTFCLHSTHFSTEFS